MADSDLVQYLAELIKKLRFTLDWKPGSASRHLLKRKLRGHLPADASMEDYEQLIRTILTAPDASVYVYEYRENKYLSLMYNIENHNWLFIASFDGVVETAFVVENPKSYLNRASFRYIGKLHEVLE